MRRLIAFALVLGLLGAFSAAPAIAKKKKKPVTFEASGTVAIGHPAAYSAGASIVGTELSGVCGIPVSQGSDGFVVELPEALTKVAATVAVTGSDATGLYDLDMYFYNAECAPVGAASTETQDEIGAFGAGTKYILVNSYMGAEVEFELKATEMK